jgi:hypothetical protein
MQIRKLMDGIVAYPRHGIGQPEPLRHELAGLTTGLTASIGSIAWLITLWETALPYFTASAGNLYLRKILDGLSHRLPWYSLINSF